MRFYIVYLKEIAKLSLQWNQLFSQISPLLDEPVQLVVHRWASTPKTLSWQKKKKKKTKELKKEIKSYNH